MTRFQNLLAPGKNTTPKEEQDRASKGLADAVSKSHLQWWKKRDSLLRQNRFLVLAVAPFSRYDLALLDAIDETLGSAGSVSTQVFVANLMEYDSPQRLESDFPGIGHVQQTPIATLWESGKPTKSVQGKHARDLAAEAIGISHDSLQKRIVAGLPSQVQGNRRA